MASIINTNINSITAQRNLAMTQSSLSTSMQRLSSGLRINSAKDDAAGLAISERFTTQIRGLNQASRNANDGISLAQTAEGALAEVTSNLQRIRELAVQSANATNSASDRSALNQEVQQRLAEIDRVASQTTFNSQKILDGSFGNAVFQVGADVGQTIGVNLGTSMRQSAIGAIASAVSTVDLRSLVDPNPTAATTTSSAIVATNFASTAATAGSSTVTFGTIAAAADKVVLNGVTFTIADGLSVGETVVDATNVTITRNITGGGGAALDTTTSAAAFAAGIAAAKADSRTATALATVSATSAAAVLTVNDSKVGTAAYAGRTLTATIASGAPTIALSATGIDGTAGKITVGGTSINLTTNIATAADLVSVVNAGLDAAVPPNTAVRASLNADSTKVVFSSTATGAAVAAPTITGSIASVNNMIGVKTAVAGADSKSLTVAEGGFSVAIGTGMAVNVKAATYTTSQAFVDAVTTAMGGNGSASLNSTTGVLSLNSANDITIAGTTGLTTLGITADNKTAGSLDTTNVTDVAAANLAIQRVDSALSSVSTLRSSFGAIQNRFDSVIASLSTTSENLSASRSRVQDADFAQETANLSRAQILQQAGTAMVAQANQLPQGVLALLR